MHRVASGETPKAALKLHHGEVLVTDRRVLSAQYPSIFFSLIRTGRLDHSQRVSSTDYVAYGRNSNVSRLVLGAMLCLIGLPMILAYGLGLFVIAIGAALIWESLQTHLIIGCRTGKNVSIEIRPTERQRALAFMAWVEQDLID